MNNNKSLAELRGEKKMSQRDLARKLGVSSATIGMYESGKRTPSLKKAILIARLVQCCFRMKKKDRNFGICRCFKIRYGLGGDCFSQWVVLVEL